MTDRIFDIEDEQIVVNENVLLIPWLKIIVDTYENYINALAFVKYSSDLVGAYSDYEADEKEAELLEVFPGDYKPTDEIICTAISKLEATWNKKTTYRHFRSVKILVDKFSTYAETVMLNDSKETNNITAARGIIKDCLKTVKDFAAMEKTIEQDVLKTRGKQEKAYDL